MMDYLRINFEEMRFGAMKEAFESLERAFRKFDVDFYLIGAFARDMWMNHLEDLPIRRTTNDVDFSLYVRNYRDYANLTQYLVDVEGFVRDDEPYRLYSKSGTMIDLIPFGGIEQNNQVYLEGSPPMTLSVFGNQVVFNHAESLEIEGSSFKICTLPGLCILKLIAGHEKADRMEKDMGDFYYILENYFEIAGDTIYDGEFGDLIDEEFDPLVSSIKMLGRQMKPILTDSDILSEKIMNILNKLKEKFNDQEIDQMYLADPKDLKILRFKLVSTLSRELSR